MSTGRYDDGRSFLLPQGWNRVEDRVLEGAAAQARKALGVGVLDPVEARKALASYFDPEGNFSGALFSALPGTADDIVPADLLAVTTLSMRLPAAQVRQLLDSSSKRSLVLRHMRNLPEDLPVAELGSGGTDSATVLTAAEDLYTELKATPTASSRRWVFAAKLCSRKRPLLMPVRDTVVCKYLANSARLHAGPGQVGTFRTDIQIFGYLMSCPDIADALADHWTHLEDRFGRTMDSVGLLRVLDVALWRAGLAAGYGPGKRRS